MLVIPHAPATLRLALERHWDGTRCPNPRHRGEVSLALAGGAAPGTRVANLWEYDVVECFLVGDGGRYLEIELGAGGHFLLLGFDAPRRRSNGFETFVPELAFGSERERWLAQLRLPLSLVPSGLCALNAFAIAGGGFLAHGALPGATPDFHQPRAFPRAGFAPPH
jgi:hypothetical protein